MTRKDGKLLGRSVWTVTLGASIAIVTLWIFGFPATTSGSFLYTPRAETIWVADSSRKGPGDDAPARQPRRKKRERTVFAALLLLSDRAAVGAR